MPRRSNKGPALVAVLVVPLLCPATLHADTKADYERLFGEEEREVRATRSTKDDAAFAAKLHTKAFSGVSREFGLLLCDKSVEFGLKDPSGYQQVLELIQWVQYAWGITDPKWALKELTTLRLLYSRSTGQQKKDFGRRYLNALWARAKAAIDRGKREEAHKFYQQALSVGKSIDDPWTDRLAASMKRNEQAMGRTLSTPSQRTSQPAQRSPRPAQRERTPSARPWSTKPSPGPAQREPQAEVGSKSEKRAPTGKGDTTSVLPCCFVWCIGGVLGLVLCLMHCQRKEAEARTLAAGTSAVRKQISRTSSKIETSPQSPCKEYLAGLDIPLPDDSKPPPDAARASKDFVEGLHQIQRLLKAHPEIDSRHFDFADQVREADMGEAEALAKKLTKVKVCCPSCKTSLSASLVSLGTNVRCPDCKQTFALTASMLEPPPLP